MINIILFVLIFTVCYQYSIKIIEEKLTVKLSKYLALKNEKYHDELMKYYKKNKKIKINSKINPIHKLGILIERAGIKQGILMNPLSLIFIGLMFSILCYIVALKIFEARVLSFIIAMPTVFTPIVILKLIADYNDDKIEKIIPNFLLQLKNYTQINNDIIYAIKESKTIEPLQSYINKFLIEINSGIKFENAIDNLNEKIKIKELEKLFSNIKNCYISGGSFAELINKSYYMISIIQKEKLARKEETKGARIVLMILVLLDLIVYFSFIGNNKENYMIMQKSIVGKLILYWNFISMWLLVFLSQKVKEVDE
ncbi:MAG: hypothetical protein IKK43_03705 [Clostridia bacterium]|nr:hypothetical protein [Clostridia bacterium]